MVKSTATNAMDVRTMPATVPFSALLSDNLNHFP